MSIEYMIQVVRMPSLVYFGLSPQIFFLSVFDMFRIFDISVFLSS